MPGTTMGSQTFAKQMLLTLVSPTRERQSAMVTLTRTRAGETYRWSATACIEQIEHTSHGHADERGALVDIAEWLRGRFGASTTCLGSTVAIVGVSPVRELA